MSNRCLYLLPPDWNPIVARDLLQSGEYKYFQDQQRLALTWIVANPKQFVILTVQRFILFWFPLPDPSIRNTTYRGYGSWLVTLLSIPGLWLLYLCNKRAAAILATVL